MKTVHIGDTFEEMIISHMKDSEILEYLPIKSKLTLKKHLDSLVDKNYLQQISKRPSQHSLSEFLKGEFE